MTANADAHQNEAIRFARRILGVPSKATPKEIRNAFARRAKVVHPDRFDPVTQKEEWAEANAILREFNEAYRLALSVAEKEEKLAAEAAAAPANPSPAPAKSTPISTRPRSRRSLETEYHRTPIGFFDLGIFLVVGFFQMLMGTWGVLGFLTLLFGIDLWFRWKAAHEKGGLRRHFLLPRMGLSFACMPMWIASVMFGSIFWIFPWNSLGSSASTVGGWTFLVLGLIAASFWFADYSYEIARPD